jgi:ATP-dependent DNA helicase RecQ
VVATLAFGLGVNFQTIRLVVHLGIPSSAQQYWQEIGRCSR